MFIENYSQKIGNNTTHLAFIKSSQVNAYPCGRRRSTNISVNSEGYRIPFDPEARLNTEANNRKHSSLNGFTQTYLKSWDTTKTEQHLCMALAGYFFAITLENDYLSYNDFGNKLVAEAVLGDPTASRIYANVVIEDTHLFSGFKEYYTGVLRSQTNMQSDSGDALDIIKSSFIGEAKNPDNYYFSGLSFSTQPITDSDSDSALNPKLSISRKEIPYIQKRTAPGSATEVGVPQILASLCILERELVDGAWGDWKIHQPAYLPKIEHGTTEDSVIVTGNTSLESDLEVLGKAEVAGNITSESNIIAVGNSETAGNIIADRNIRAKNDITVDRFLNVKDNAKILKNLTVGPEVEGQDGGTITAKKHVETPTLNASTSVTTPTVNVSTELNVQSGNTDNPAQANIDEATITDAEIINKIKTKDLESTGVILANIIGDTQDKVENIIANTASIDTLTAGTINANDIQQKIDGVYKDVPVIFVQPQKSKSTNKTEYQLQIRRVNFLTEQQVD